MAFSLDSMDIVYSFVGFPETTEWLKFYPEGLSVDSLPADFSALANSAALMGRKHAYAVWGIASGTHALTGTSFDPASATTSMGRELSFWLERSLSSNAVYRFREIHDGNGRRFVVARINVAGLQPVLANGIAYLRRGARTVMLDEAPEAARRLQTQLRDGDFEDRIAAADVSRRELLGLLDAEAFFRLLDREPPVRMLESVEELCDYGLVRMQANGRFSVTNLGALLLARHLRAFPDFDMRPIRVMRYAGIGRFDLLDARTFDAGYCLSLPAAEEHVLSLLRAMAGSGAAVPRKAVHELLVNAVVHQDLACPSAGPTVSVFDDRVEFANPGASLVDPDRMLNSGPMPRNAKLAAFVRRVNMAGEGGMGWGLAVASCEHACGSAPQLESDPSFGTRAVLRTALPYREMTKAQRMDAAYWHACLSMEQGEPMGNTSLRERFGLPACTKDTVAISRLIHECVADGLLKPADPNAGTKQRRYIPAWA